MQEALNATLCIFVKPPIPGRVKTRLCPPLTGPEAAELAAAFFVDTLAVAGRSRWSRVVVACDGDPAPLHLASDVTVWPQGPGDLGERMERVLTRALSTSAMAAVIGSDSPGLPHSLLDSALNALTRHDAVVGPTQDGGFFLLGLRRCPAGLLHGLPWSVATTRACTLQRLRDAGFDTAETQPWFDVDLPQDLAKLAHLLRTEQITSTAARLVVGFAAS